MVINAENSQSEARKVAKKFVQFVVDGNFIETRNLLAYEYKADNNIEKMKESYAQMVNYYNQNGTDSPTDIQIHLTTEMSSSKLQSKQENDVGWYDFSTFNDFVNDAIAVTVCFERNEYVIRDVVWGRP